MGGINFLEEITFKAIGYIKSRYESTDMMPKSSNESMDETAELIIDRKYLESMKSMKADEEYMLIFYFHKSDEYKQTVPSGVTVNCWDCFQHTHQTGQIQ